MLDYRLSSESEHTPVIWTSALRLLPLLLLPLPLILAAAAPDLSATHTLFLTTLPWLAGLVILFLSLGFKQSRLLLMSLHLALATGLIHLVTNSGIDNPASYVALVLLGLISPIMQAWILLTPERSTLSRTGLVRISSMLAIYISLAYLWLHQPLILVTLLPSLPSNFIEFLFSSVTISHAIFWWQLLVLTGTTLLGLLYRRDDTGVNLLLGLTLLLILARADAPLQGPLYHLLGQLILFVALIRRGYAMAFVDTLTGVPGRRALEHCLASPGKHYSLAMLDIDHFKQFNDRYGHDTGDQVLRMVATQLRSIGAGGQLFRYGGEEFTIVFKRRSEEEAFAALEAVRERIAHYPMKVRSPDRPEHDTHGRPLRERPAASTQVVNVTISIGVCTRAAGEAPDIVIKKADEALYAAKRGGRNCTRTPRPESAQKKGRSRNDFARSRN